MPKTNHTTKKQSPQQMREQVELKAATDEMLVYELRTNRKTF
jgi:hypothetical protein